MDTFAIATEESNQPAINMQDQLSKAIADYFNRLDGQKPQDLYNLVLREMELPLLEHILKYTKGNQSKAAIYLGISRGTLRKLMKAYHMLD